MAIQQKDESVPPTITFWQVVRWTGLPWLMLAILATARLGWPLGTVLVGFAALFFEGLRRLYNSRGKQPRTRIYLCLGGVVLIAILSVLGWIVA